MKIFRKQFRFVFWIEVKVKIVATEEESRHLMGRF